MRVAPAARAAPAAPAAGQVRLGTHGNVKSCFLGQQQCQSGEWGSCDEPAPGAPVPPLKLKHPQRPSGQQWMSLSNAAACNTDPCDPSCQTSTGSPTPVGSPPRSSSPPEDRQLRRSPRRSQTTGTTEPCDTGGDCQFDQFCYNPTSGVCAHSKCVTGGGLSAACDPCVQQVCNSDPSCCNTPQGVSGGSTCSHDLCIVGAPLKNGSPGCDPCVDLICTNNQYSFCCNQVTGGWTAECVERVTTVCGKSCSTGTWGQSCVDRVKSDCGAFCVEDETVPVCAHDKCYLGGPLSASCDTCVQDICAQADTADCCTTGWTGKCLQKVATLCGAQCPAQGDCVPWLPTQTDPDCAAIDLTIGVGCDNAGTQQVPVCNHGQMQAPAGLSLVVYPPSPPKLLPDYYVPYSGQPFVTTTEVIPPGDCINVPLPAGTADGSQLVINPFNGPAFVNNECHGSNNWSIWSAATGACATPSCAGASAYAKLKKIKLFVTIDKSASQCLPGTTPCGGVAGTRWANLSGALTDFIQAPASDDLAVWMRFWPYNTDGQCPAPAPAGCSSLLGCKTPNVDVPDLASAANENALITAISGIAPSGNTPMFPALDGALRAASEFQTANPDYVAAVLMVTDGEPTLCNTNVSSIAGLASSTYNAYGIRTYVIGIADVSATTIQTIAGAGGGKSFLIASGAADVKGDIATALSQIKQDFVSCTLTLPNQNIFDPSQATLTYTPGAGAPLNLADVGTAAACGAGNGWYYDNPGDPESITLCPTTCTSVKNDVNGKLELSIECISQYLPSQYTQTYEATCPPGKVVQWGFFAYDSTAPGDSKVEFRFRTSADGVTYGALPAAANKTASAALSSEVCALGGPAPCPVSLYDELGGLPDARKKFLEVVMDFYPTTNQNQTPSLNDWDVTYSCPDAE
ncbi:MAG: hypothetical protein R3F14_12425 [Polyangiaceae bacterium]